MPRFFRRRNGAAGERPQVGRADIDAAIKKLKSSYREYAAVYGERVFNIQGFEDRYHEALVNRVNLASFLQAEITVFRELKRRAESRNTPNKPTTDQTQQTRPYSEVADRIIAENLQRIKKYRCIDFHPDAEEEAKYLLGAATDFYYDVWGDIQRLLKPYNLRSISDSLDKLENEFCCFVIPVRGRHSREVEDYTLVLQRKNPRENERASYKFIKDGGILLNNCLKLVNHGLNFFATNKALGSQMRQLEAHKSRLLRIIDDFRLADIRGY
jgi:hypothetical protein